MDLAEISRKRVLVDLDVANVRIVELSIAIDSTAAELNELRSQLARARAEAAAVSQAQVARPTGSASGAASTPVGSPRARVRRIFNLLAGRRAPDPLRWHFDEIGGRHPERGADGIRARISTGAASLLSLSGWVVPTGELQAFDSVKIVLRGSGAVVTRGCDTFERADVAAHFGDARFERSGFRLDIPMSDIPPGLYDVIVTGCASAHGEFAVTAGKIEIY